MVTYRVTGGILSGRDGKLVGPVEMEQMAVETAEPGDELYSKLGVCAHHFDNEAYGDVAAWTQRVVDAGFSSFRSLASAKLDQVKALAVRARLLGLKWNATVATEKMSEKELRANLDFVLENADIIVSVEGINEPDGDGLTDAEVTKTVKFQKIIYDFVKSHDELAHVVVLSPALRRPAGAKLYKRMAAAGILGTFDAVSVHHYLNGPPDVADLRVHLDMIEVVWKCSRFWLTETGGTTAIMSSDPRRFTEQALAAYAVRLALEFLAEGRIEMLFRYELMDDRAPLTVNEAHFGIFNIDGSPKPEVQSWQALFATTEGGVDPIVVDLEVTAPPGVDRRLFVNGDGEVTLWLWRPGTVFDVEPVDVQIATAAGVAVLGVAGAARGVVIPTTN